MQPADPAERGVDLLAAVRHHPVVFLLPIVVLAVALGVYGATRTPTYTAEARIAVGQLDEQTQGLPGFAQAGAAIAAAYARAVDAPAVAGPAGRAGGVDAGTAAEALDASPIPDAPLIRVEAERADEASAVRLANAGAAAIVAFSRENGDGTSAMLRRYAKLSREVRRLAIRREELERRYARRRSDRVRVALQNAEGKYRATVLRRDALANAYGARATGTSAASLLEVLAPAATAESDRRETTVRLALTGALAGLVIGLALAAWRASRRRRRAAV